MKKLLLIPLVASVGLVTVFGRGGREGAQKATIYIFIDESPHIVEIDGETNEVLRTADVPEMASKWTWMDPNNYIEGNILWAGTIDTDNNGEASRVLTINLDTLEVTDVIDLGPEPNWFYIGKPTNDGRLFIGKHAA